MKKIVHTLVLVLALAGASTAALAHRFHFAISEMSDNARTGSLEVVHTMMSHDVDDMLVRLHKRQVDLSTPEDEALLRAYVEEKFYVTGKDGKRLPLKWVGMTVNVENVVIYRELEAASLAKVARVHDEVLMDFLPRQVNTVNIKRGSKVVSLTFDSKHTERKMK